MVGCATRCFEVGVSKETIVAMVVFDSDVMGSCKVFKCKFPLNYQGCVVVMMQMNIVQIAVVVNKNSCISIPLVTGSTL